MIAIFAFLLNLNHSYRYAFINGYAYVCMQVCVQIYTPQIPPFKACATLRTFHVHRMIPFLPTPLRDLLVF